MPVKSANVCTMGSVRAKNPPGGATPWAALIVQWPAVVLSVALTMKWRPVVAMSAVPCLTVSANGDLFGFIVDPISRLVGRSCGLTLIPVIASSVPREMCAFVSPGANVTIIGTFFAPRSTIILEPWPPTPMCASPLLPVAAMINELQYNPKYRACLYTGCCL